MDRLINTEQGLVLQTTMGELHVDFINDKKNYWRPLPKGKNELIAKALGLGKGIKTVVDATAGLAQDTITLARLGFEVIAIEQNKEIFSLLQDAYVRAFQFHQKNPEKLPWITKVQFVHSDSTVLMDEWVSAGLQYDAVYIDPMFPATKSSALPRKEMQIFRQLVEENVPSTLLLEKARQVARSRVVVKRPLKGSELVPGVNHSYKGTSVRYDLYLSGPRTNI